MAQQESNWKLTTSQCRILAALGCVAVIVAVVYFALQAQKASQPEALFGGRKFHIEDLMQVEFAFAAADLKDYSLQDGAVYVPRGQRELYLKAIQKAGIFVPENATAKRGSSALWQSEAQREAEKLEEKQIQLAQQIRNFHGIESACVFLDVSECRQGFSRQKISSASVRIHSSEDYEVTESDILAIRRFVVCAVLGLQPENVVIIDTRTNRSWKASETPETESTQTITPSSASTQAEKAEKTELQADASTAPKAGSKANAKQEAKAAKSAKNRKNKQVSSAKTDSDSQDVSSVDLYQMPESEANVVFCAANKNAVPAMPTFVIDAALDMLGQPEGDGTLPCEAPELAGSDQALAATSTSATEQVSKPSETLTAQAPQPNDSQSATLPPPSEPLKKATAGGASDSNPLTTDSLAEAPLKQASKSHETTSRLNATSLQVPVLCGIVAGAVMFTIVLVLMMAGKRAQKRRAARMATEVSQHARSTSKAPASSETAAKSQNGTSTPSATQPAGNPQTAETPSRTLFTETAESDFAGVLNVAGSTNTSSTASKEASTQNASAKQDTNDQELLEIQHRLRAIPPHRLAEILMDERPQSIALVLSQLESHQGREVLTYFTSDIQLEVLQRMTASIETDSEVLKLVTHAVLEAAA